MANCTVSPICDSYNYRPSDKTCQLNTHDTPLIANSADIVSDNAWSWWSPIFCNVVWAPQNAYYNVVINNIAEQQKVYLWIYRTNYVID